MRLVFEFWRRHLPWLGVLIVFTAVSTVISMAFPYVLRYIIDGIQSHLDSRTILRYVGILLAFGLARSVLSVLLPFSRGRTNEQFVRETRNQVYATILQKDHRFTNKYPSGDVLERLDQDLHELSWFSCSGIFRPIEGIFMIALSLFILLRFSPFLTLVSILPATLIVIVWMRLGPFVYRRYRAWREKISEVTNLLESSFSGIRLIKSYAMEDRTGSRFRRVLNERIKKSLELIRTEAKIGILHGGVSEVSILIVLWVGGTLVIRHQLTLGEFVAFNAYVLMLITPMFDIGNFFVAGRRAQAGSERIVALREFPGSLAGDAPGGKVPVAGEIVLSDVSFRYAPTMQDVLHGVTMRFPRGAKVGIAGTVGSGKTTVIRLLLRLASPTVGSVRLDGIPAEELISQQWRSLFGYAPQEPTLFSETVRNNIAFGRPIASEQEMQRITSIAQLDSELKEFPKGIDEVVGESGTRLSGGQKERIAIARALVGKPRIVLFDDATSSLDSRTEKDLIAEVLSYTQDATMIIISHRLSILSACDLIYVLDRGRVIESGTHEHLLTKQNLYWRLYERQLMEEELETT
jgi:ATP-binding cassette subfamily B protein